MINRLKKLTPQFKNILKIISKFAKQKNFSIYLVGGVTRDLLLKRPLVDLDIVVEGDAIELVKKVAEYYSLNFRKHHSFKTATLYYHGHKIDFATAREEHYPHPGSLPKVRPSSLKKDLLRRDFTINSMAVSLNTKDYGRLIDFYDGQKDIKAGLIKILHSESFLDDSLRILRAIRFEQRFLFKIETKTYALMKQAIGAGALGWINPHRLREELILFLKEDNPYRYIKRFYQLEKFNFISEQLRLEKNDFKFIIRAQTIIRVYKKNLKGKYNFRAWLIYLSGMLLKLPDCEFFKVIDKFGFKKEERATIIAIKRNIRRIKKVGRNKNASDIYRNLKNYNLETIIFFYVYFQDRKLRENINFFMKELYQQKLKVKGRDLKKIGVASSSVMGKILKKLFFLKLDKKLKTKKQELEEAKKIIAKQNMKKNNQRGKNVNSD